MKKPLLLCAFLCIGWSAFALAKEEAVIEFTGRLFDMALGAPYCGTMQFESLVIYDRVQGSGLPDKVVVVHPCIELARSQYSASAGNLQVFTIGARHRVQVSKSGPASMKSVVRGKIDPGSQPIYHAIKVDLVVEAGASPKSVGELCLGEPNQFPAQFQEAARSVGQSMGKPKEFYAQIDLDRKTNELVFHLWHQDAFLPENKNMVGNPGGKCRDVYYSIKDNKVTRTLFWQ